MRRSNSKPARELDLVAFMRAHRAGDVTSRPISDMPLLRRPILMNWIQHDHRYLALGLELIISVGRPEFERLFPKPAAFVARGCPASRVHLLGPDLDFA